jgi:hypothetical protein
MREGLKISNDEEAEMRETLLGVERVFGGGAGVDPLARAPLAAKKRFLARPTAGESRDLLAAIDAATGQFRELIRPAEAELTELEKTDYAPAPLITGDDLTAEGLNPGPVFKRVLDGVYDAQLEARVATKDEALGLAMRLAREGSAGREP